MEAKVIEILDRQGMMAVAAVCPDEWPQNTFVAYANGGMLSYFLVSRSCQKFANIQRNQRVAIAIDGAEEQLETLQGLTLGAVASEVTDAQHRQHALDLLLARHPAHQESDRPDFVKAAMMRALPEFITILDYTQGFGHADEISFGATGIPDMWPAPTDDWGWNPAEPEPEGSPSS